jgi:hypothetical protein
MPKRQSQFEHDYLLEMLAEGLYGQKLTDVKADLDGFHRPSKITLPGMGEGAVPDATAFGTQLQIYEVETADSINDKHTEVQWRLFAKYAQGNNAIFHVVVPPMCMGEVRRRLKELSIEAKVVPMP